MPVGAEGGGIYPHPHFITRFPEVGSGYKYRVMFERVSDFRVVEPTKAQRYALSAPFMVMFGDKRTDYRYALKSDVPYILVQNDVHTARDGSRSSKEKEMLENASGVLFTSEGHAKYCLDRYDIQYFEIVHLRPLRRDMLFVPKPKLPGRNIVYCGGIGVSGNCKEEYAYRCYDETIHKLQECGWTVHVYPSFGTSKRGSAYTEKGCIVREPVPQNLLYEELSQFQAGLQAYSHHGPQDYISLCTPNKTFEYLAGGIPTLGHNTGPAGEIYDGKWGSVVRQDDFESATEEVLSMNVTDELRFSQTIDQDVVKFQNLIERVLGL